MVKGGRHAGPRRHSLNDGIIMELMLSLMGSALCCADAPMWARVAFPLCGMLLFAGSSPDVTASTRCRRGWTVSWYQSLRASCLKSKSSFPRSTYRSSVLEQQCGTEMCWTTSSKVARRLPKEHSMNSLRDRAIRQNGERHDPALTSLSFVHTELTE